MKFVLVIFIDIGIQYPKIHTLQKDRFVLP